MKRFKWFCLIVCFFISNSIYAEDAKVGYCGNHLWYNIWKESKFIYISSLKSNTIDSMWDFGPAGSSGLRSPFYDYRAIIETITIDDACNIGSYAFDSFSKLKTVELPITIKEIGAYSFARCPELLSVSIPQETKVIGDGAFYNDTSLESACFSSIESFCSIDYTNYYSSPQYYAKCILINGEEIVDMAIPTSIKEIKNATFAGCKGLKIVRIPNTVVELGDEVFKGNRLNEIIVSEQNPSFSSDNGVLFNKSKTELIAYPGSRSGSYSIPHGTKIIWNEAFWNCRNITELTIPSTVTTIGDYAFYACTNLTSITNLSDTPQKLSAPPVMSYCTLHVKKGCKAAYSKADYWKNFTIVEDDGITVSSIDLGGDKVLSTGNTMKIEASYLPENATDTFFSWESSDENIVSVDEYGNITAKALGKVTITATASNGVYGKCVVNVINTIIEGVCGPTAFYSIGSDGTLDIKGTGSVLYSTTPWYSDKNFIKAIRIHEGITSICEWAFWGMENLVLVELPNTLTSIANEAFVGCPMLEKVNLPSNLQTIGDRALAICGLKEINIPSSVTSIGEKAFSSCENLPAINVDVNNKNYSSLNGVLYNKAKNILLTCPAGYKGDCNISERTVTISEYAFGKCSGLTSVTIPKNVKHIYKNAFYDCTNLKNVTCYAVAPPICGTDVFTGTMATTGTLYVPLGTRTTYSNTYGWNVFGTIVGIGSVNVTINEGGNVTLAGKTYTNKGTYTFDVHEGDNVVFTITPAEHKYVKAITVDGTDVTDDYQNGKYTIENISASHNVVVTFADATFTITFNTDGGTTVNPVTADYGTLVGAPNPPTKNGYKFIGWDRDFPFRMPAENITVTALWEIQETSGKCGEHATWSLDKNGKLTIGGYGDMYNYGRDYDEGLGFAPWLTSYAKIKSIEISEGITSIGDNTFGLGSFTTATIDVSSIILPDGIKRIGKNAFNMCKSIISIIIPNSVTVIDDRAFLNLENLTSIELSNSLISIGRAAFSSTGIDNIELPNSLTSIGDDAFDYCENLSEIAIPRSVVSIGAYAFCECINLKNITNYADQPQNITSDTFHGVTGATLHVKIGCKEAYSDADVWKNFTIVEDAEDSQYLIGDANGDKNVSISDYSAIVSHILDNTPNNFIEKAADVNCDGNISVSDLSALVQIILYQNDPVSRAKAFSYIAPKASLYSDDVSFDANDEASVRVNLDSNMAVDGFQFDIVLPENIQLKDIQQGTCRHNGNCTFRYAILKNGNIRVLCSSTSNSTIDGADGGIVEISLVTNRDMNQDAQYVQIVNGEVSSRGTAVKTDDFTIRLTSDYTTGVNLVSKNKKMMIYDLNGRLLKRAATASDFKSLPKGIYIVDGNKIVK